MSEERQKKDWKTISSIITGISLGIFAIITLIALFQGMYDPNPKTIYATKGYEITESYLSPATDYLSISGKIVINDTIIHKASKIKAEVFLDGKYVGTANSYVNLEGLKEHRFVLSLNRIYVDNVSGEVTWNFLPIRCNVSQKEYKRYRQSTND